jgi:hypothetical protein
VDENMGGQEMGTETSNCRLPADLGHTLQEPWSIDKKFCYNAVVCWVNGVTGSWKVEVRREKDQN